MSVKYNIEVPHDISADFWKFLNQNFKVIIIKKQHSVDGDMIEMKLGIIETKYNK